jgi:hypothetical protein
MCANDCNWNMTYCRCGGHEGISFHGLKLVNGQTVIADEVVEARAAHAAELAAADAELEEQRAASVHPNHPQCVHDMMAEVRLMLTPGNLQ